MWLFYEVIERGCETCQLILALRDTLLKFLQTIDGRGRIRLNGNANHDVFNGLAAHIEWFSKGLVEMFHACFFRRRSRRLG